jgi:hypothetical protein
MNDNKPSETIAPVRAGGPKGPTPGFDFQVVALVTYLLHVGDLTPELFALIVLSVILYKRTQDKSKMPGTWAG